MRRPEVSSNAVARRGAESRQSGWRPELRQAQRRRVVERYLQKVGREDAAVLLTAGQARYSESVGGEWYVVE